MNMTEHFQDEFLATYRRTNPNVTRTDGAFRSALRLFAKCCYGNESIITLVYLMITEKIVGPDSQGHSNDRFRMAFFVFNLDHSDPLDSQYYWTDLIKSVLKENDHELYLRYLDLEEDHGARLSGIVTSQKGIIP